ncbi:hypothetical protein [Tunturiibacter gelidoferens]|uniref:Uncharacterized protein n=2 Tax=Tunturiibacter TaxID=3154218 RepID=A0A7Y9TB68_9BACT|nr:hypothetical protein [Edaphobacter lichenicola]MBB5337926.1 hypothetical protein [Edaphobacter lichenicola]NYF52845.1 hypothetical protein [Edaphobacter lichenicola]
MIRFNLVGVASFRSTLRLGQVLALLFVGLGASIALRAQSVNLVSFSPSFGNGSEQVFVATYFVPRGVTDGQSFSLFIMNGVAPGSKRGWSSDQCILTYNVSSGVIQLAEDSGGKFLSTTATAETAQSVSNSQCSVLASLSSATISGDSVTVRFFVAFSAAFRGAKQLYLSADSKGWMGDTNPPIQVGTYNVTASVSSVFISPSSGSGSEETFMAIYSDVTSQIQSVFLNLKSSGNNTLAANACKLRYDPGSTDIFLVNDAGTNYGSPLTSGSTAVLSNSQCTLFGIGTYATTFGNNVIAYFRVSFAPVFVGKKEITLGGVDQTGVSTFSNLSRGTYIVTASSPAASQTFTLTSTPVNIAAAGGSANSAITVFSNGGFKGSVALTCAVISPGGSAYQPTCQIVEPSTVWLGTSATATLVVNTTAASASTSRSTVKQLSVFYSSVAVALLVFFRPRIRWKRQTILLLLVFTIVSGAAIGCGRIDSPVIEPTGSGATNSGTTVENYIIAVTGTSGSVTATTAVSVTVK